VLNQLRTGRLSQCGLPKAIMQLRSADLRRFTVSVPVVVACFIAGIGAPSGLFLSTLLLPMSVWASCEIASVELPVTLSGLRPLVTATINGVDVNFVLDSGAFWSMITPAAAEQFNLPHRRVPFGMRVEGVGGRADIYATRVKEFTLAKTAFPNVEFIVGGNEPGANAVGLIGQNFLAIADVEYDLGNGAVRIAYPGDDCKKVGLAYWAGSKPYSEIELLRPRHTVGKKTDAFAYVNDVKMRVAFDTGSATSILSLPAAERAGLVPGGEGVVPAWEMHGIGHKESQTWIATVRNFTIGGERITNTHLRIGDFDLLDTDMLLGADFFLSHRIYVANSREKIYFTYNGGRYFDTSVHLNLAQQATKNENAEVTPGDAQGYARRGAALVARQDFPGALADMTRACELDPGVGKYFLLRGQIRLNLSQQLLAMSDFNEALRLDPDDVDARLARAQLHIAGHDAESARADLGVADKLAASQANSRLAIAQLYLRLDLPEAALGQYNQWIVSHAQDVKLNMVLNSRCWARALMGTELDKALDDCDAAVKSKPESAAYLDSRGLVYLRLGKIDKALDDYDAALRVNPKIAWSLYGRGIVRLRKGAIDAGNADIAAAKAIRPSIATDAKRYGIE
jgi:tetratricopeptide (TPR) repeat protein